MDDFSTRETIYYAAIWVIGTLAARGRIVRDNTYRDSGRRLGACSCGGFAALAMVGLYFSICPGGLRSGAAGVALAAAVGLGGRRIEKNLKLVTDAMFARIFAALKIPQQSELDGEDE